MEALVQCLPIEISEKIYKYVVAAKLKEKNNLDGAMFTSRFYQLLTVICTNEL